MREEKLNINQAATIISVLYINNAFFGFIKEKTILNAFCLLCMVLWVVVASTEKGFIQNCFETCISLIVFASFLILVYFFTSANMSSGLWQNLRDAFFSLICSFLCLYILPKDERSKRSIFIFVLINILLGCIYTLYRIQEDPLLPRVLARGSVSIEKYFGANVSTAGIITYGGIYGMALIFPTFLYWISQRKGQKKLIPIIISIVIIVTIFKAQFAIALIFLIVSIILYLILCGNQSRYRVVFSAIFIMITFIIAINIDNILYDIHSANILPSALQQKVHELLLYSENSNLSGTNLYSRSTYYVKSFEAIVQNNFVGRVFSNNAHGGGHSEWEDMAANYGIIAPILVYFFFFKFTKKISTYLKNKAIIVYRIQLLMFLMIGFIDPIFQSRIMSYLIFLSPLMLTMNSTFHSNNPNVVGSVNKSKYIRHANS